MFGMDEVTLNGKSLSNWKVDGHAGHINGPSYRA